MFAQQTKPHTPSSVTDHRHWLKQKCGKKKARIGDPPGGHTVYNASGDGALVASLVSSASVTDPALRTTKKASVDLVGIS